MTTIDLLASHRRKKKREYARNRAPAYRASNLEKIRQAQRERSREWAAANPDENRRRAREGAKRRRAALRAAVRTRLGGACAWCGTTDLCVLEVDHINGGGGKERREGGDYAVVRFYKDILAGRRTDARLLCANCNRRAYYKAGPPQRKETECVVWSS